MARAPADRLAARLARVRANLAGDGIEALIVTHLPNIFYLTNFDGSAAIALVTGDQVHLITDSRYVAAADGLLRSNGSCPGAALVPVERTYEETLVALLGRLSLGRIGFEAAHMSVARYSWLASALGVPALTAGGPPGSGTRGVALVSTERSVERVRLCKDEFEIGTLRAAAARLSALVPRAVAEVRAGRTERAVAAAIDRILKDGGFDRTAFETIVASGPNAALPHAHPGERCLAAGDLILLDFGGVSDGYFVDLSRTVSLGEPGGEARRVYEAVADAQAAALAAIGPGVLASAIDRAARGVLEDRGLGEAFGHGTGHGLGVELHEEPRIARARSPAAAADAARAAAGARPEAPGQAPPGDAWIEAGMVFTVEPGVYRPGWGGVRLEDDVLVTGAGYELLTKVPRELQTVRE